MGTRHLTYVYDDADTILLCMYGQWDGYILGHGQDLANFLYGGKLVNGIPFGSKEKLFNGMGCLAAQLVAHFKKETGSFYIYPPKLGHDCWQEFEYHIYPDKIKVLGGDQFPIFSGTWEAFAEFCDNEANDDD
jgi:hypothetical protein